NSFDAFIVHQVDSFVRKHDKMSLPWRRVSVAAHDRIAWHQRKFHRDLLTPIKSSERTGARMLHVAPDHRVYDDRHQYPPKMNVMVSRPPALENVPPYRAVSLAANAPRTSPASVDTPKRAKMRQACSMPKRKLHEVGGIEGLLRKRVVKQRREDAAPPRHRFA